MDIGHRLTSLREEKKPSQGDIEKRTGLLRCYISRVKNGHTGKDARFLNKLSRFLAEMSEGDREVLLSFAEQMPNRRKKSTPKA